MHHKSLRLHAQARQKLSVGLVVLALTACGGGGGGSAPTGAPPASPPAPPTLPSLVPTPPPLGTVFAQSALSLRPLSDGMVWRYRGKDFSVPTTGNAYTTYESKASLSQIAGSVALTELTDNLFGIGSATQTVRVDGSTIVNIYDIELTDNIVIDDHVSVELRSPVQENDQYTVFERNGFNFGADVDGDGRSETADAAIFRRVVGLEDLNVRGVTFTGTVRVDTITRLRLIPTSGAAPATGEFVQSDWYASGVGIVKRLARVVGSTRPVEVEEELVAWDGLTAGIGAMASVTLRYAAPGGGVSPLLGVAAAVPFDTHVLLFSHQDVGDLLGVRSSKVDLRGRVLTSNDYPTSLLNTARLSAVRLANEAFLLTTGPTSQELQLARFDSDGNLLSDPVTGISLPGGPPSLVDLSVVDHTPVAVGVGAELWIAWIRIHRLPDTTVVEELVVRPFDRLGNPLASETIVRSRLFGQLNQPRIVMNGTVALLGFIDTQSAGVYDYVTLARNAMQPITAINPGQITNEFIVKLPGPVSTLTSSGIIWEGLSTGGSNFTTKGLKVDSNGLPVRVGAGLDFSAEDLPGTTFDSGSFFIKGSGIASIPVVALKQDRVFPDDLVTQGLYEIGQFTPGAGAWASTGAFGRSVRIPSADFLNGDAWMYAFSDRLLLVTSANTESRMTVVWRRGLD